MGAFCCPPALDPPTPQHKKCRKMLQGLAVALLPMAGLAAAAADNGFGFQIFISLFMIMFLFLAWRTFSWCTILMFLLYSMMSGLQTCITFAGYIQYQYVFEKKHVVASIFLLYSILFYFVAIPLSHFAYKVFKTDSTSLLNGGRADANDDHGQNEQLMQRPQLARQNHANNINEPNYFRGEAVRIG